MKDILTKSQKGALLCLAQNLGLRPLRGVVHSKDGTTYYPTRYGWQPVVLYNWKEEYRKLEKSYEDVQSLLREKQAEVEDLREVMKMGKQGLLEKIWRVVTGHITDEEKVRQIKRYLIDKKKGQ
jgi:hypothetical protein